MATIDWPVCAFQPGKDGEVQSHPSDLEMADKARARWDASRAFSVEE